MSFPDYDSELEKFIEQFNTPDEVRTPEEEDELYEFWREKMNKDFLYNVYEVKGLNWTEEERIGDYFLREHCKTHGKNTSTYAYQTPKMIKKRMRDQVLFGDSELLDYVNNKRE